jgi:pimeloyl-ACP methyl ester carboxylesterase
MATRCSHPTCRPCAQPRPALDSVEALADWLLGLLDAAGVERAALVGHSMGSLIALEAAARAPQRVSHLAMLGTAFPMTVSSGAARHRTRRAAARDRHGQRLFALDVAGKPAYPARAPGCTGRPRADAPRAGGQRGCNLFLRDFEVCNRYATASPRPAGRLPGRLRARRKDQMTAPRQAAELAAALRARGHDGRCRTCADGGGTRRCWLPARALPAGDSAHGRHRSPADDRAPCRRRAAA